MRRVGGLLLVALCACAGLLGAASAGAEVRPLSDGGMVFGTIRGSADPEEFSFSVDLAEGQKLRLVDERNAEVFYQGEGFTAFSISAESAHDANGTNVPTTLSVSLPNIVTLTVHHREGNPAAGGAPFTYPILAGSGWEGGFRTITVPMGEQPPQTPTPAPDATATAPPQPQRVLVTRALGEDKLYFRPHSFLLSADGTFRVGKVVWQSYGEAIATATGRGFANDCIPNCAAGRFYRPQANLRLSRIVTCQGKQVYSRLHYALTGPLPKGFPRQGVFSMLPLDEDGKPDC
jgi:hypothetical protein